MSRATRKQADTSDFEALNRSQHQSTVWIDGHGRRGKLDAMTQGMAKVVEDLGTVAGCSTGVRSLARAVGETNQDVRLSLEVHPKSAVVDYQCQLGR